MKSKFLRIAMCIALAFALCLPSTAGQVTKVSAASSIALNVASISLYDGQTYQLQPYGTTKKITWTTSNKDVATVSKQGLVTAVGKGKAKITAKSDSKSYSCTVTVVAPYLSESSITLEIGETKEISITGTAIKSIKSGSEAIAKAVNNYSDDTGTYTFNYLNDYYYYEVGEIYDEYDYALYNSSMTVTAMGKGSTTITVKGDNGKSYKLKVKVTDPYVVTKVVTEKSKEDYSDKITETYKYDKFGNVTTHTQKSDSESFTEKYTYYSDGTMKTYKYEFGDSTEEYKYNENGDILSYTAQYNGKTTIAQAYEYDSAGRIIKQTIKSEYEDYSAEYTFDENNVCTYEKYIDNIDPYLSYEAFVYFIGSADCNIRCSEDYTIHYDVKTCNIGRNRYLIAKLYNDRSDIAISLDKNNRPVKVTNLSDNSSIEFKYNKVGELASETKILSWYDYNIDAISEYELVKTFTYDDKNRLIAYKLSKDNTLLKEGKYIYDADGNQYTASLYSCDNYDGSESEEEYTYDGNFNEIKYTSSDGYVTYTCTSSYNSYGKLSKLTIKRSYSDGGTEETVTTYKYDKYGNIATEKEVTKSPDRNYTVVRTYKYDKNGNLLSTSTTDNGVISTKNTYTYTDGVLTESVEVNYKEDGSVYSKTVNKYDANKHLILYTYSSDSRKEKETYEYTAGGALIKSVKTSDYYYSGKLSTYSKIICEYDENGNTLRYYEDYDGDIYEQTYNSGATIKYDSKNRPVKETGDRYETTYTYDKTSGKISKKVTETERYGSTERTEITYTYKLLSEQVK